MSTLIDRLREDIQSTRADINRIDGQQETAQIELEHLQEEAEKLGFSPDAAKIRQEVTTLETDVTAALKSVQEEVASLGLDANAGQ